MKKLFVYFVLLVPVASLAQQAGQAQGDSSRFNGTWQLINEHEHSSDGNCSKELQVTNQQNDVEIMTSDQSQPVLQDGGRIDPSWSYLMKEYAKSSYETVGQILVLPNKNSQDNSCGNPISCKTQELFNDEGKSSSSSKPKELSASAENNSNDIHKKLSVDLKLGSDGTLEYHLNTLDLGNKTSLSCKYKKTSNAITLHPNLDQHGLYSIGPDDAAAPVNAQAGALRMDSPANSTLQAKPEKMTTDSGSGTEISGQETSAETTR